MQFYFIFLKINFIYNIPKIINTNFVFIIFEDTEELRGASETVKEMGPVAQGIFEAVDN